MKKVIVFDDDIWGGLKSSIKPQVVETGDNGYIIGNMMFGMQVFDGRIKGKELRKYMFHRKKRIQKKWDKKYNDFFIEKTLPPFYLSGVTA